MPLLVEMLIEKPYEPVSAGCERELANGGNYLTNNNTVPSLFNRKV